MKSDSWVKMNELYAVLHGPPLATHKKGTEPTNKTGRTVSNM